MIKYKCNQKKMLYLFKSKVGELVDLVCDKYGNTVGCVYLIESSGLYYGYMGSFMDLLGNVARDERGLMLTNLYKSLEEASDAVKNGIRCMN
jgi:hypothetical protein